MARRKKGNLMMILFIVAGLLLGGIIGELASSMDNLWWLGYGKQFGFTKPIWLDLNVLKLSFSIIVKINIASVLGAILSLYLYKKY